MFTYTLAPIDILLYINIRIERNLDGVMDRMKSAFEKAMERVELLDEPGEEQRLFWTLAPLGKQLAVAYLKGEDSPFSKISDAPPEHRAHLTKGMFQVLVSNLLLPKSEAAYGANDRIIKGLERLIKDKPENKEVLQRAKYVSDQYWQFGMSQRDQAYQQLKLQMEQQVAEAMSRQRGSAGGLQVNVETMPEFQQQWMRVSAQIDRQYGEHLEGFKRQLLELV